MSFNSKKSYVRLVHATWAAGQPYRNRETKPIMQAYDTLSPEEAEKDMTQIQAAAKILIQYI